MEKRVYNFAPGPAVLPLSVIEEVQRDLLCLPGAGASIMEISHRSKTFDHIITQAEANIRKLFGVPDNYRVLFMQGGAFFQFAMVAMNLLRNSGKPADYIVTGTWSGKSIKEAKTQGTANAVWDGKPDNFIRFPKQEELKLDADPAYVYMCSNETIQGVQYQTEPETDGAPLICDTSSDIFCRPMPVEKFGLIFACAQKNAGPSGVTLVIVREDLLERSGADLPSMLSYKTVAENKSMLNTPPTFPIYVVKLVTDWLLNEIGGLDKMAEINNRKAKMLYDVIDESEGFYQGHAQMDCRSTMNVPFRMPSDELQAAFLAQATDRDLCNLKGHRSVGGCRASIYNAMPVEGVELLAQFMREFCEKNK